ncbi:MAG TPA: DUF4276 family protein [Syntrophomonadaceae bacterium]|nr:DUF4276 family protein [Syntrophomonadaceae bacterium]HPR92835.1 DUF4276 family protein [Syntrophomonadaceae bacterium]
MARKVLLCGEGPTDCGKQKFGSTEWEEGPVQPIIMKLVNGDIEFAYTTKEEVKGKKIQRRTGAKVTGHGAKSYKLCMIAEERKDIDNIICYVDADREHGSRKSKRESKKRLQEIYSQISNGFQQFSAARSHNSIPMVPLKMIESWLLADDQAFAQCFESSPANPVLPGQPELIWGDENNPSSNHPKNYLKRVLEQYNQEANRDTFKSIAEEIDIDALRERCPLSFEIFYQDIKAIC